VEDDLGALDPARGEATEEVRREVQPRRRAATDPVSRA